MVSLRNSDIDQTASGDMLRQRRDDLTGSHNETVWRRRMNTYTYICV